MKQEPIFSSGAEALLAVKLFELRNHKNSALVQQEAIDAIFGLVVVCGDDEALKDRMVAMNAIETILDATKRSAASAHFLHRAAGIFVELVKDSQGRSTRFIGSGGVDRSLEIMKSFQADCFLMTSYVAVLMMLLYVVTDEQRVLIAGSIFKKVVSVMERHYENANLYLLACDALGHCFGPGVLIRFELWGRAVQCIFDGIVFLKDHEDAKAIGGHLLVHMVGPVGARQLIDHAEMHHCETAGCSCAA